MPCLCILALFLALAPELGAADVVPVPFVRGDANASGNVDLADAVSLLGLLFLGWEDPTCLQAADTNVDGRLDLTDGVFLLGFLFLGGEPPAAPFPDCGPPAALDSPLSCKEFEPCGHCVPAELPAVQVPALLDLDTSLSAGGEMVSEVTPELHWALRLLAPGESIFALQDLHGFPEFSQTDPTMAWLESLGQDIEGHVGTVIVRAWKDPGAHSYHLSGALLDEITWRLAETKAASEFGRIVDAEPRDLHGNGTSRVLLVRRMQSGATDLIGCDVSLDEAQPGSPPADPEIDVRQDSPASMQVPIRCGWMTLDALNIPSASLVEGEDRRWDYLGGSERVSEGYESSPPGPKEFGDGWYASTGPGPFYQLVADRKRANCLTPATEVSLPAAGSLIAEVDMLCFDANARKAQPRGCSGTVDALALYASEVRVSTTSGLTCPAGGNPIEAVAQDEAIFRANSDLLFSKGVVVQTGNSVSTKIELGLGVNAGLSSEKGSSANAGVQIGVSQTTQSETGAAADLLNCRGVAHRYCPPVSLELAASGKAQINASYRTVGIAEATTQAQGLGYVAASDCPGAGVVYRGWIRTRPLLFHDTRRNLTQFLETRSGLQIDWGPWMEVERRP